MNIVETPTPSAEQADLDTGTRRTKRTEKKKTPDCPPWCSAYECDAPDGEHIAEPATVCELDGGDQLVTVRLSQAPSAETMIEIERWTWNTMQSFEKFQDATSDDRIAVPLSKARDLIRIVSAAMWAGSGARGFGALMQADPDNEGDEAVDDWDDEDEYRDET